MKSEKKATSIQQQESKRVRKLYYKIGEVCEITELPHHVIRFWEREFPQLAPRKTSTGHRIFSEKDIQTILLIKDLLYNKKFTIKGAREYISNQSGKEVSSEEAAVKTKKISAPKSLVDRLKLLRDLLDRKPPH
ncbi:MAG: MerR family transcriptional regulator [Thermoanaerobaculaceae bacterium]|nr:MerR family transcriptional regulator [Thermoanaerobaculaceae bacterium]